MVNNVILYFIIAFISSSVSVVVLCFGAKFIHLRREYTELIIPVISMIIFVLISQIGFMAIGIISIQSVIYSAAISQILYILCRKIGMKSNAVRRHWIIIGISFLFAVAAFMFVYFSKNIKDSLLMLDSFFVCILNFIFIIFNMIFYKITKEISFAIRKKKND